jgi:uncharacterized protein YgiM (DUF1202 family)
MILKEFLAFLFLALFCLAASGQTADVKRNVNLRVDASTDNPPIELLKPPAQLTLLEPDKPQAYYHVTAPDGKTGFVWAKNVEVQNGVQPPGPAGAAGQLTTHFSVANQITMYPCLRPSHELRLATIPQQLNNAGGEMWRLQS